MRVISYRAATFNAWTIFKDHTSFILRRIILLKGDLTILVADSFAFFIAYRIMVRDSSGFLNLFKLANSLQLVLQALAGLKVLLELLPSLLKVTFLLSEQGHLMLSFQDLRFDIALFFIDFCEFVGQYYLVVLQKTKKFFKLFKRAIKLLPQRFNSLIVPSAVLDTLTLKLLLCL